MKLEELFETPEQDDIQVRRGHSEKVRSTKRHASLKHKKRAKEKRDWKKEARDSM